MNLIHLEYFRELAYSEHVQETAKKLHISASAISAGLRTLENELGITLFDRIGRNMRLNENGKILLPYVEQAFLNLQQGQDALDIAQSRHKSSVAFSIKDAVFWCDAISAFNVRHPEIYIRQIDWDPDDQGKLLDQANLDFMLTDKDLENDTLESCVLYKDTFVLAVPPDHPMAGTGQVHSIFDFAEETFLSRPKRDYFQQRVDHMLAQIGFQPQNTMEFEYMLRFLMLEKKVGVVVTTKHTAKTEYYSRSSIIRIREFEGYPLIKKLYWKRGKKLSVAAKLFQDYMIEVTDVEDND